MRLSRLFAVLLLGFTLAPAAPAAEVSPWPEVQRENKPWTRWWWPGSAVDKVNLTHQLEQIAAAGLGGVEITPIYGANGYEDRYLDFLSPEWMAMLTYTTHEAQRLGLGVDMVTGTGWPFGGPWIDEAHASMRVVLQNGKLTGAPTKMLVKRAAPGGEGLVIDPFSTAALKLYLAPFTEAFKKFPRGLIRSQFHDSFEYYDASWTPDFPRVFQEMNGYDVQQFATELLAPKPEDVKSIDLDTLARIKSDYRDTLAKLHLDYLHTWVEWSHQHGFLVRNQSHGAPGNLLDLYANADIPETEVFGSTPFPIPGLHRYDDEVRHDQDLPEALVIRMASSAAHVMAHPLASSETCTWLRDHWKVALSYIKPEIDRLFVNGINHIIYHGTVFSPEDAPWPGWLFYAASQLNPNNPLWDDFSAVNRYVARVQSILQIGKPDNDILLYWPVEDVWNDPQGLVNQLTVHNVKWLLDQRVGKLARKLMDRGFSFDYISDAQLQELRVESGRLRAPGGHYRVLVVPATQRMPASTIQRIAQLSATGATVIFESLPEDVPGYGRLEARRAEFNAALAKLGDRAVVQSDVLGALEDRGVAREAIVDLGISFIRRSTVAGHDYFFANLTAHKLDGWVSLGSSALSAMLLDPLSGMSGAAALRPGPHGEDQVYLQLAPGESMILRTHSTSFAGSLGTAWPYLAPAGESSPIPGPWQIGFIKGGPDLPPPLQTTELKSWTDLGGAEAKRFGGTARYHVEFVLPTQQADQWELDLGDVRESARVRLNGKEIATAWSVPFVVRLGSAAKPGRNVLEVDVTNLAANRIRDLDQRKIPWKIMREINFVNINYQPFDASKWELKPSGLLGPVRLIPLRIFRPSADNN
jgi:hypothetical protein